MMTAVTSEKIYQFIIHIKSQMEIPVDSKHGFSDLSIFPPSLEGRSLKFIKIGAQKF